MEKKYFELDLDLVYPVTSRAFSVVEGDTGNVLSLCVTNGGTAVDLTEVVPVLVFSSPRGVRIQNGATGLSVTAPSAGELCCDLYPSSYSPGRVNCELQLYSGSNLGVLSTSARFCFNCVPALCSQEAVEADAGLPPLVAATESATTAAAKINGLTVSAVTLPAGSAATAALSDTDSGFSIAFGIPEGEPGAAPTEAVSSVNTQTGQVVLSARDVGAVPHLSEMPPASAALLGKCALFCGAEYSESGYYPGFVYRCIYLSQLGRYAWERICDREAYPLSFGNVAASAWVGDSTYPDYTYKCELACSGADSGMLPEVVFAPAEAASGNYAPVALASHNKVTVYAKVNSAITVPRIVVWRTRA